MALIIPCQPGVPHYDMQVVLDDATFTLEFQWNVREASWYMHIRDEDSTPLIMGTKVVINFPLAARSVNPKRPAGRFVAQDTTEKQENPGLFDLGERVQLLYYAASELS